MSDISAAFTLPDVRLKQLNKDYGCFSRHRAARHAIERRSPHSTRNHHPKSQSCVFGDPLLSTLARVNRRDLGRVWVSGDSAPANPPARLSAIKLSAIRRASPSRFQRSAYAQKRPRKRLSLFRPSQQISRPVPVRRKFLRIAPYRGLVPKIFCGRPVSNSDTTFPIRVYNDFGNLSRPSLAWHPQPSIQKS